MNRQLYLEVCRRSLLTFVQAAFPILHGGREFSPEWYNEVTCHELQRVMDGEDRRLIINQPPRTLKSITTSVVMAAFILGNDPSKRIMVVSYSSSLAEELSRSFKALVQSSFYKELFPAVRLEKVTADFISTDQRGARLATTVGGSVTGFGADYIIVDDPISVSDAQSEAVRESVNHFFAATLSTRLDNPSTGRIIVVMQRVHEDDLSGRLLSSGHWRHLKLPAIATEDQTYELGGGRVHHVRAGDLLSPRQLPQTYLDSQQAQMGSYLFAGQYQQDPVPVAGNMVKRHWFKYYDRLPSREVGEIVLSLDTATKSNPGNDYSVCTVWLRKGPEHYLIDVWRDKVDYPDLQKKVLDLIGFHNANRVLIEDNGSGTVLCQMLRTMGVNAIPRRAASSKEARLAPASAAIESGRVFFPRDAPFLADYEREFLGFPGVKHDDQVDSTSQYLNWAEETDRTSLFSVDWGDDDGGIDHGAIGLSAPRFR